MTMKIDWLRGCATALVTPFKENGAIDEERLRSLIEYQITNGMQLLVPCGTTGESVTMTEKEDQRVIEITVEATRGALVSSRERGATQQIQPSHTPSARAISARTPCSSWPPTTISQRRTGCSRISELLRKRFPICPSSFTTYRGAPARTSRSRRR